MIAFDTNIAIYALNGHPKYAEESIAIISEASRSGGCVSVLLLTELLSYPKLADKLYLQKAEEFVQSLANLDIVAIDEEISRYAATLMRQHETIRLADALHIASASLGGASAFWTNDQKLKNIEVPGLRVCLLKSC